MLETKELSKIYKPKKGVPVTALDKVSIKFPRSGMVFLLGKSGSGKSTLLNLLGGLDSYDGGEILIKGESTKNFRQKQFDSYRNTYVGFIFQEYNILDEFTVGANIALAIELQNRRAGDDEINSILDKVDLSGYGNRKPNELSGGQKQRVAIARALVKNPEIIMADEPTGALDSATGKQVLDTLKKLSADKLVIIVSHDREFAEAYADRIIELADGRVISDVTLDTAETETQKGITYNGSDIEIPARYRLTEQDREQINAYLEKLESGARLSVSHSNKRFVTTDTATLKTSTGGMQLIKSRLPGKCALKIGASGLKYKKFRLVMTVLLSCIAFGLFGLSDTFGAYNHIRTCTNSIMDTGVKSAAVEKSKYTCYDYWANYGFTLSKDEISDFAKKTGIEMHGVYIPKSGDLDISEMLAPEDEKSAQQQYHIYQSNFSGISEMNNDIMKKNGFKLAAGSLPNGSLDEAAISDYIFSVIKKRGLIGQDQKKAEVRSYSDILGKTIDIADKKLKITGIIDTGFDLSRYQSLEESSENKHYSNAENILRYALYNEFNTTSAYSYAKILMVGEGFVEKMISESAPVYPIVGGYISWSCYINDNEGLYLEPQNFTTLNRIPAQDIVWVNGEKNVLGEDEIIVSSDQLSNISGEAETSAEEGVLPDDNAGLLETAKKFKSFDMSASQIFSADEKLQDYSESGKKIVGILPITEKNKGYSGTVIVPESLFSAFCSDSVAPYSFAVGKMPENRADVEKLVITCYQENNGTKLPLQNSVTYELDSINSVLQKLSKVFLYVGIGFACFAALMLANFIATSISHKKQEIGILRAIGSRSNDVFRIFFSESLIIAAVNFLLSSIGVGVVTAVINQFIRRDIGVLITVLSFGVRQILLLAAVSVLVALAASYLPVKRIASKRPIDAIRDR